MARANKLHPHLLERVRALWCASLALVLLGGAAPASAAHTQVSFEFFHSSLTPFGSWHASASYGQVWIPHLQVIGWHPYAYGHWVYSDYGWTWVSTYEWGAIPYHYGTWALDPELGWVWVPGYTWAPAWVVFRSGPSYVGWAPVPPAFSVGVSFSFNDYGADHFVFVREGDFVAADVHRVAVPVERTRVVFRDTKIVNNNLRIENNVVVNRGIDVQRVERVARAPVERESIERVPKVAPAERVTRDELRVDPSQMERGRVRAAAPAQAPREQKPDARQPRDREPEVKQPRREPAREQSPPREPEVMQPKRERAPERPPQREPQIMQPRREPARERPRAAPEQERPQVAPQPEHPQQREPAEKARGKQRGGPPPQGEPAPEEQPQEHGPMGERG